MNLWDIAVPAVVLLIGVVFVVRGALGSVGRVSVGCWASWTRANREGGRNQILLGVVMLCYGGNLLLTCPVSTIALLGMFLGLVGYTVLSILHRRRYGSRPPLDSRYASERVRR
ncbi:hypothetical protein SAMN04487820_11037 [Actinopolyspora mzabensis]|uniref:Uncharacterized protein n=1 Tax=Actinopolyspora mzabensis TaxID=995066 RepID=A0A1G9DEB3_ACTMZ|nr:hypothetical protein [Actinopolyspora mzabensis]SDK62213.1 hypothetical protein SAMN04487820_11037 [Actinopolyspora mzabensis]